MSTQAPIIIDLAGSYRMPGVPEKQSGSITGDLRLSSLDAFLLAVNQAMAEIPIDQEKVLATKFNFFMARLLKDVSEVDPCLSLEVQQSVDTSKKIITYTFSLKNGTTAK